MSPAGRAIALSTLVSGTLDILFAMILTLIYGREIGNMLRYVASAPFPQRPKWARAARSLDSWSISR